VPQRLRSTLRASLRRILNNRWYLTITGIVLGILVCVGLPVYSIATSSHLDFSYSPSRCRKWSQTTVAQGSSEIVVVRRPLRFGALYAMFPDTLRAKSTDGWPHIRERLSLEVDIFRTDGSPCMVFVSRLIPSRGIPPQDSAIIQRSSSGAHGYQEVVLLGYPFRSLIASGHACMCDALYPQMFMVNGPVLQLPSASATASIPRMPSLPTHLLQVFPLRVRVSGLLLNFALSQCLVAAISLGYCITTSYVRLYRSRCPNCGYSLLGVMARCSECGFYP
jgi:hypothetical protein